MLEYDRVKLGEFFKTSREKASLTQAEVAAKLGYSSAQFISNIERGVSVTPLSLMAKLARLYKVHIEGIVKILMDSQATLLRRKLKAGGR